MAQITLCNPTLAPSYSKTVRDAAACWRDRVSSVVKPMMYLSMRLLAFDASMARFSVVPSGRH